jgi:hypothetical protein
MGEYVWTTGIIKQEFIYDKDRSSYEYSISCKNGEFPTEDEDFKFHILTRAVISLDIFNSKLVEDAETLRKNLNALVDGTVKMSVLMVVNNGEISWETVGYAGRNAEDILFLMLSIESFNNMLRYLNSCVNDKTCPVRKEIKAELKRGGLYKFNRFRMRG